MAGYGSDDGAANNGFGRHSLHQWEGRLLYAAGYPGRPNFRARRLAPERGGRPDPSAASG
jgi:hypothetical protein